MNYLTENSLKDILVSANPTKIEREKGIVFEGKRYRVDYEIVKNDKTFFVEFNGYHHYNSTKVQIRDIQIKKYCILNNITLIEIPYFIQYDKELFERLFSFSFSDIKWEYPHGFHDNKALRPCDFNIGGWKRFIEFYDFLLKENFSDIAKSIYYSIKPEEIREDLKTIQSSILFQRRRV